MDDRIKVRIDPDLEDLVPGFLENRRKDVDRLTEFLQVPDFTEIRLIGHSMKGAGGGYGFDEITEIGSAIEEAALLEDAAAIKTGTEKLADYLSRVDVVLDQ
ncbi:MAG: Hpt domain-containing protein [Proteobacteria bacterium]|nr:Hpt domain-containing protein [Pseudomonadota bacterium]